MLIRRERKSPNDVKFSIFIGRFPSGGAASMAVKGLNYLFFVGICFVLFLNHVAKNMLFLKIKTLLRLK